MSFFDQTYNSCLGFSIEKLKTKQQNNLSISNHARTHWQIRKIAANLYVALKLCVRVWGWSINMNGYSSFNLSDCHWLLICVIWNLLKGFMSCFLKTLPQQYLVPKVQKFKWISFLSLHRNTNKPIWSSQTKKNELVMKIIKSLLITYRFSYIY